MFKALLIPVLALGLSATFADEAKAKTDTAKTTAKKLDLVAGKKVYETNCVSCHGAKGKGDGPVGINLKPKPRDFTDTARVAGEPMDKMRKAVAKGGASVGYSPLMPAWKGILKDDQIDNVLGYVLKTFSGEGTPKFETLAKAAAEKAAAKK